MWCLWYLPCFFVPFLWYVACSTSCHLVYMLFAIGSLVSPMRQPAISYTCYGMSCGVTRNNICCLSNLLVLISNEYGLYAVSYASLYSFWFLWYFLWGLCHVIWFIFYFLWFRWYILWAHQLHHRLMAHLTRVWRLCYFLKRMCHVLLSLWHFL